jgi:lantibiotic biosynthesis protein
MGLCKGGRSFGRFADMMNDGHFQMLRALYRHEETHFPDAMFAEVVYTPNTPQHRSGKPGNVAMCPSMRDLQIPVNVMAADDGPNVITLSDLVVGMHGDELRVFSASRGVEVIATQSHMLTSFTAPNAARFLLDVSGERCGGVPGLGFLAGLSVPYFPRLVRGRTVLRPAEWKLSPTQTTNLLAKTNEEFVDAVHEWRERYRVPRHVYTAVGDQRLLFDLDDPDSVDEFRREIDTSRRRAGNALTFVIQEMLPSFEEMWVTDSSGRRYASEFILPLSLGQIQPEPSTSDAGMPQTGVSGEPALQSHPVLSHRQRTVPVGDEWAFLKLYLAEELQDSVIAKARALADELFDRKLIDKWFFIRYADPERHLRLRFRAASEECSAEVLDRVVRWGRKMIAEGLVRDQELCGYTRELERYGGPEAMDAIESLFYADSMVTSDLLHVAAERHGAPLDIKGLCVVTLNELFRHWGMNDDKRYAFVENRTGGWQNNRASTYDRTLIRELLCSPDDGPVSPGADKVRRQIASIFDTYSGTISATSAYLSELDRAGRLHIPKEKVAESIAHMHVNRLAGLSGPAEAEIYVRWHYGLKAVRGWRAHQADRLAHGVSRPEGMRTSR